MTKTLRSDKSLVSYCRVCVKKNYSQGYDIIDWGNVEDVTDTSVKIWISGKEMAEERINNKTLRCYALMIHNDAIQTKLIYKNVEDIMERRKRIDYDSRPKKVIETMNDPRQRPICHTCGIKGHTAMYCPDKSKGKRKEANIGEQHQTATNSCAYDE